ncbi:hypothetical protein MXD59_17230 [Frankia sp. Ag45/Mut15]|uniref:Uncharacterized protein n=1 Tax=Frankia umida TaxID=573489 RepID=A0ABT0K1T7_9ACTN|nr:hypothetical protein [Frankia umida]MCK9877494.1 hypothetical protein [Frankia umida]
MILKRTLLSKLALFLAIAVAFVLLPVAAAQARPVGGARVDRPGAVVVPPRVYRPGVVYGTVPDTSASPTSGPTVVYVPPRVYTPPRVYVPPRVNQPGVGRR